MRITFLVALLMLAVSCGKDSSSEGSKIRQSQEVPDLMWDGIGKEFKEAVVSVPASVNESQIVISQAASDVEQGERIKCAVNVNANETFHISVNGETMYLQTNNGNYTMKKVNTLNGYLGTYSTVFRTSSNERIELLLALQPSHIVLRKKCEG